MMKEDIEFIKEQVKKTLLSVRRQGMTELVEALERQGYFDGPCSTKYHLSRKHGLLIHHWHIYNALLEKNNHYKLGLSEDTIILVALLHDLCKVGMYTIHPDNTITYTGHNPDYKHGTLSLERITKFISLTEEEEEMIKHHMGLHSVYSFEKFSIQELYNATTKFRTVQVFASTDQEVTMMEDAIEKEEQMEAEKKPAVTVMTYSKENFLKAVKFFDNGSGVFIDDLIKYFELSQEDAQLLELRIVKMIERGELFEHKPGFIKILE
jgi:hypothetical protein